MFKWTLLKSTISQLKGCKLKKMEVVSEEINHNSAFIYKIVPLARTACPNYITEAVLLKDISAIYFSC